MQWLARPAVAMYKDLLSIVEAAYKVEIPSKQWLEGIAEACRPWLDDGFGLCAFEFQHDIVSVPVCLSMETAGMDDELAALYPRLFDAMSPELRARPFVFGPCTTGSQMVGQREEFRKNPAMARGLHPFGAYDTLWITAADPSGYGVGLHVPRKEVSWVNARLREQWARIAAHVSAGGRLRRRLAPERETGATTPSLTAPAAILTPDGRVQHATAEATEAEALETLRLAVLGVERARERKGTASSQLMDWKALVGGRWSLVDEFEGDGRRFVVARENTPKPPGPTALTEREGQVLGYAALGHHNKLIAYDLGISHATVRVLLSRACSKLGVTSREEAVEIYRRWNEQSAVALSSH